MWEVQEEESKPKHTLLNDTREQWICGPLLDGGLTMEHLNNPEKMCEALRRIAEAPVVVEEYGFEVAACLRHPTPQVQVEACAALQNMGTVAWEYSGQVTPLLNSDDASVRRAATSALASFGSYGSGAANDIAKLLNDQDASVRCVVLQGIGAMGDESFLDDIVVHLDDNVPEVAAAACSALSAMGGRVAGRHTDAIAAKLGNSRTRHAALEAMYTIGEEAIGKYIDVIVSDCLGDPDYETRQLAITSIACTTETAVVKGSGVVEKIVDMLQSQEAYVRASAALALGQLGEQTFDKAENIVKLLQDDETDTNGLALQIGGCSRRNPILIKPRCAAIIALGMMGREWVKQNENIEWDHMKSLTGMLEEEDWEVRSCALDALLMLGEKGEIDGSKVSPLLEDEVYLNRAKACNVLGMAKASETMDSIMDLFEDGHHNVRAAALLAASATGEDCGEEVAPKICKFLKEDSADVRAAAVRALGQFGDFGRCYAGVFAELLQTDPDDNVRCEILEALGNFGPHGAAFIEEIADCLNDYCPQVRVAAVKALGQMGEEALQYRPLLKRLTNDSDIAVASAAQDASAALET